MLAGLLAAYLIFSGGGGFAAKMFGKDTQALVRDVVPDHARAAAAVQTLKRGEKEMEAAGKRFEKIAKQFTDADEAQTAGLAALEPLMRQAWDERKATQQACLDRLFELKGSLTAEEWAKIFAGLK
jgi:hypothetical protein